MRKCSGITSQDWDIVFTFYSILIVGEKRKKDSPNTFIDFVSKRTVFMFAEKLDKCSTTSFYMIFTIAVDYVYDRITVVHTPLICINLFLYKMFPE